jgi:hypothetical protein
LGPLRRCAIRSRNRPHQPAAGIRPLSREQRWQGNGSLLRMFAAQAMSQGVWASRTALSGRFVSTTDEDAALLSEPTVELRASVRRHRSAQGCRPCSRCGRHRARTRHRITTTTSRSQSAKPVATARRTRTAPGEWPTGSHSGRLGVMCKTIATYSLYGLDAVSADLIVEGDGVRVVERGSGRTLVDVKQESGRRTPAGVQSGGPILVWRESAPETMSTGQSCLFSPPWPV